MVIFKMLNNVVRIVAWRVLSLGFLLFWSGQIFSAIVIPNVILAWDPSPDESVVGYYLYTGTEPGQYTAHEDLGDRTTTAVSGLTKGVTYYFAVTAYNAEGLESDPSNEISFVVPGILRMAPNSSTNGATHVEFPVEAGRTYILQASEDLSSWTSIWETLGTTNGWIRFTDTNSVAISQRFYRLQLQ